MATLQWTLDPAHSEVQFKVRHMGVSNVSGEFKTFDVTFTSEDSDFLTAKATFTAPIDSISTGVEHRDNHLKSDDFFDAIHHPTIFFESTQFSRISEDELEMTGNMTMRGVQHREVFKVINNGIIVDPYGNHRTGFEISGKINRFDYGLKYNDLMELGGMVVGNDIRVLVNVELFHK